MHALHSPRVSTGLLFQKFHNWCLWFLRHRSSFGYWKDVSKLVIVIALFYSVHQSICPIIVPAHISSKAWMHPDLLNSLSLAFEARRVRMERNVVAVILFPFCWTCSGVSSANSRPQTLHPSGGWVRNRFAVKKEYWTNVGADTRGL